MVHKPRESQSPRAHLEKQAIAMSRSTPAAKQTGSRANLGWKYFDGHQQTGRHSQTERLASCVKFCEARRRLGDLSIRPVSLVAGRSQSVARAVIASVIAAK